MTRAEVLAALDASDAQVRSRLTVDSTEPFGEWSAKDLLFHIASWQRFFGVTLRTRREAGREATASELLGQSLDAAESARLLDADVDASNAYLFELYRNSDWNTGARLWADGLALLRDEVGRLSDEELAAGEPLWRRIGSESFTHIEGHLSGSQQGVG
jgi:hypothetical protein